MKIRIMILAAVIVILGGKSNLYADERSYVWTYEYMTEEKGEGEIEYYFTAEVPDESKSNVNTMKHWIELEYGITNHWDIALYQMLKQKNNDSDFEYDGFKIRTRYRLGEKNKYLLDPLIYLEYIRDGDFSTPNVLEEKIILAKDIGNFNFSYNQILKQELEGDGKTEHEYAFGLNYAIEPPFKIGLESKGNYTKEKYYLGPTVSFVINRYWVALGAGFGLNKRSDDIQIRLISGILF